MYTAAMALAIGIGIQNFPEGAAISFPLRQEGLKHRKVFRFGKSFRVSRIDFRRIDGVNRWIYPAFDAVAASLQALSAMLYVVVEELIPEAHLGEHSNIGTLGVLSGFLVMMILDVALVNLFIQHQIKILIWFFKSLQAEKERQLFAVPFSILIGTIAFLYQYLYSFYFPYQSINPIGY